MGEKLARFWGSISIAQAIVLVALIAGAVATVLLAPEHLWEKLAETDPLVLGAWLGTILAAIAGVFTRSRSPAPRPARETIAPPPSDDDEDETPRLGTRARADEEG